jgi:hypothetical protein
MQSDKPLFLDMPLVVPLTGRFQWNHLREQIDAHENELERIDEIFRSPNEKHGSIGRWIQDFCRF